MKMKRILISAACLFLAAGMVIAAPQGKKTKKQLQQENEDLRRKLESLEAEIATYRAEEAEREVIEEELSGENENKVSAGLEDYTTVNTDTLLGQWYMHRHSRTLGRE